MGEVKVIQYESQYGKGEDKEVGFQEQATIPTSSSVEDSSGVKDDGESEITDSEVMGAGAPLPLPNHIEEYLKESVGENAFRDLFEAEDENVDLRTHLNSDELVIANKIFANNAFIFKKLGINVYGDFLINYLRYKISYERLSRTEFVDINRKDHFEQNLGRFNNFANLKKVKE